jgi:hypothetical protein
VAPLEPPSIQQTIQQSVQPTLATAVEAVTSAVSSVLPAGVIQPTLKLKKYPIGGVAYIPVWSPEKSRYELYDLKTDPEKTKPFAYIKLGEDGSEKMIKIK